MREWIFFVFLQRKTLYKKMGLNRYILLLLCMLSYSTGFAQGSRKAPLEVTADGQGRVMVSFQLPEWELVYDDVFFSHLACDSMATGNGPIGHPDLPTASILIHLPQGSTLEVNSVKSNGKTDKGWIDPQKPLAPVTRAWLKDQPWPGYEPDKKVYETDAFHRNGEKLEVEHLGRMGGNELYRLTVRPMSYNPVTGDLLIDNELTAVLTSHLSPPTSRPSPSRYLIVSRPQFREGLQPFVQWKRQEGYEVVERYADTPLCDSVKALIRPLFDDATQLAPEYILIVGDVDQIQAFPGTVLLEETMHITDLYYGDFSGDYLPEALVGRWPVNDTAELNTVVRKTLAYEQFNGIDTAQLKRILLVAGTETASTAPITTNGQVNYLQREVKLAHPEIDTVCYHNPASDSLGDAIIGDLGLGACLLNYTAHCTETGWTRPAIGIGNVEAAEGNQPMVYVNNCCKSNNFGGDCFGEQLLRLAEGGAVGVVGATNSTLWNEDYYWAVGPKFPLSLTPSYDSTARGAFDGLIGRTSTVSTMGELLVVGNLAVTAFGTPYAKFYWEIYCLLGDPSLKPYIGVPGPIEMTVDEGLVNGSLLLEVTGTSGARVTAMQGDSLLGVANIDSSGHAAIALRQSLDTRPLILTATGRALWPRVDTMAVDSNIAEGVALRSIMLTDSTVGCTVENIGLRRLDSLQVRLVQSADDSRAGALITPQTLLINTLMPGQATGVVLPVAVEAIGMQPLWQGSLQVWRDSVRCIYPLCRPLSGEFPSLTLQLLNPDGSEARRLLPGRAYLLYGEIEGAYDSLTLFANAAPGGTTLSSQSPYLPFTTPDSLCDLRIGGVLHWQRWQSHNEYHLEPGSRTEGFEEGFDARPWRNNSRVPWVIDSTVSHSGRYCARSGAISHSQLTDLCIEVSLPHSDTLKFWSKASTEPQYDKMMFMVDGERRLPENWGNLGWREYRHVLTAGHHTLCWRYIKDSDHSAGSDCIWIDDVQFPMSLWDSAGRWECSIPPLGIDPIHLSPLTSHLTIYPNPASRLVHLSADHQLTVTVSDALGRHVAAFTLYEDEVREWDVSALPSGVYFVTGSDSNTFQGVKLIINNN